MSVTTCYHTTSAVAAESILKHGFHDASGASLSGNEINGVFLSAEPLTDGNGFPLGTPPEKYARTLQVEFNDNFGLDDFVHDDATPTIWHLPAATINAHATVTLWNNTQPNSN